MTEILETRGATLRDALGAAADRRPDAPFFIAPPEEGRAWDPAGRTLTYAQTRAAVDRIAAALVIAGYGPGHRIAMDLANRPDFVIWRFAANAVGVSAVPINPDLKPAEIAAILLDCAPDLAVVGAERARAFAEANAIQRRSSRRHIHTIPVESFDPEGGLQRPPRGPKPGGVTPATEASLIYTSGATGTPKGCIMSHGYELALGRWYAESNGIAQLRNGERLYNPLPLFHVNAGIVSLLAMLHLGGAQIQPRRFSRALWWRDIAAQKATVAHYLGVVIPALMAADPSEEERAHGLRLMVGAGVEPSLHGPAEERFGVPLVEIWGMTESCRLMMADEEPRRIDTRSIGRPRPGLEVEARGEDDAPVPPGTPGEMVLRSAGADPRADFFSGYLNREEETEQAWRGGWFHTGDTVTIEPDGTVIFIDRKKNIIRRSGENIAAAEVEACLLGHGAVATAAVIAIPDPMRDEEVMACVALRAGQVPDRALAEALFAHVLARLAYFKAPGWLRFVDELPVTGTQKVVKGALFPDGADPTEGAFDFRVRKKPADG